MMSFIDQWLPTNSAADKFKKKLLIKIVKLVNH